jgi:hypothetical protein
MRAGFLSWEHVLRGYDPMHLAATNTWQERIESPVTLATFDRELWHASRKHGLAA